MWRTKIKKIGMILWTQYNCLTFVYNSHNIDEKKVIIISMHTSLPNWKVTILNTKRPLELSQAVLKTLFVANLIPKLCH